MSDLDDITASAAPSGKPLSTKPVKSWKQNKATTPHSNSNDNTLDADDVAAMNARKAAEQARINQINVQMAGDLLGGFTIQRDAPKPASSESSSSAGNELQAKPRDVTDTLSDYPLSRDDDYDVFASKVADKLLQNKTGASSVLHSQRMLRYAKALCKQLCSSPAMRLDEVNLLKSYLAVLHADKTKNIPRKQQSKPIAQGSVNKLPAKAQQAIQAKTAARNPYQDDDAADDYADGYDNNDDFM